MDRFQNFNNSNTIIINNPVRKKYKNLVRHLFFQL